ncbi:glycine--tRNA ligase [Candidatus Bathyarchaeota archaeon]|nr:glycine--tRNA ligase [Candidatus Bathyarchaeota archaeon]
MMKQKDKYEIISEMAKRRGYFWSSYEIYGGARGFLTFGPLGSLLKRRLEEKFRRFYLKPLAIAEIETSVIMPGNILEASGHVENFKEPTVECNKCQRKFRADHLLQEFGKMTDTETEKLSLQDVVSRLKDNNIRCPECGGNFEKAEQFMTMFTTTIGPYSNSIGYGRPEAAQGIFVEFKRIFESARGRLPLGVAQIGHALRNEISPRQGPVRLREFTIIDIEFFFDPEDKECLIINQVENETLRLILAENKLNGKTEPVIMTIKEALNKEIIKEQWQAYFMALAKQFLISIGVPEEKQRFIEKLDYERAHYSIQGFDQEVYLERWGWTEVSGHNYRTDYDLNRHMKASGVELTAFKESEDGGKRFVPHVIEPSFGLDRLVYVALEYAYTKKGKRTILSLPRDLAPMQISVFPLMNKDGLLEKADEIYHMLVNNGLNVEWDSSGSIGRRYARSDEAGTTLGITIDYQTLEDDTITLRDRDSWKQVRCKITDLSYRLQNYFCNKFNFEDLGQLIER